MESCCECPVAVMMVSRQGRMDLVYARGANPCKEGPLCATNEPRTLHRINEARQRHDDSVDMCHRLIWHYLVNMKCLDVIRCYRRANRRVAQLQRIDNGLPILKEWIKLLERDGFINLVKNSTRPHNLRVRERRISELVTLITVLRDEYYARCRDIVYPHQRDMGWEVSPIIIGRIICQVLLASKIKLIEAAKHPVVQDEEGTNKLEQEHRARTRKHAVRPKLKPAVKSGNKIEVDTLEVSFSAGVNVYIMNTADMATRQAWTLLYIANNSASVATLLGMVYEALFLERIQIDSGPKFRTKFEDLSYGLGMIWHILPPRSPKPSVHVETFNSTIVTEFLSFWIISGNLDEQGQALKWFTHEHNNIDLYKWLGYEKPPAGAIYRSTEYNQKIHRYVVCSSIPASVNSLINKGIKKIFYKHKRHNTRRGNK